MAAKLQILQSLMNKDTLNPQDLQTLQPVFRFTDDHRIYDTIQRHKKFFPGKLWHVQQTLHSLNLLMGSRLIMTVSWNGADAVINGQTVHLNRNISILKQLKKNSPKTALLWQLLGGSAEAAPLGKEDSPELRFVVASLAWSEIYTGTFSQSTNHGSTSAVLDTVNGQPIEGAAKLNCGSNGSPVQGDLTVKTYGRSLICHFVTTATPNGIHVEMKFNGTKDPLTADFTAKNSTPNADVEVTQQACEASKYFQMDDSGQSVQFDNDRSYATSPIHEEIGNYLVSSKPTAQSSLMKLCEVYYGPKLKAFQLNACMSRVCDNSSATPIFDTLSVHYGENTPLGKMMNWQSNASETQQSLNGLRSEFLSDLKASGLSSPGIKACLGVAESGKDADCELKDAEMSQLATFAGDGILKQEYLDYKGAVYGNQLVQQRESAINSEPDALNPRTVLEGSAGVSVAARVAASAQACCANADCRANFQINSIDKAGGAAGSQSEQ